MKGMEIFDNRVFLPSQLIVTCIFTLNAWTRDFDLLVVLLFRLYDERVA